MKTLIASLAFVAVLGWASLSQAGMIVGGTCAADGDGAITCNSEWNTSIQTMTIVGNHKRMEPGHAGILPLDENFGYLLAESELDPSPVLRTTMDNDTGFSWTAYDVNIYMSKPFSLSDVTVYYPINGGVTSEPGWTGTTVGSVTEIITGSLWRGQVHYVGGMPIPDGGTLDFSYKATFLGSAKFCQEMTPIPEPATLYLAAFALLGLAAIRRRFAV